MSKLRKAILIIGILVIAVAASLATALALYATGSMKTDPIELEFKLKEPLEPKVYDGTPLKLSLVDFDDPSNSDIELSKGSLQPGHSIKVEFTGSQTNVGTSMSDANIKIYDKNGFNVTNEYSIKVHGAPLTVVKRAISVELPAQSVVYNGTKVLFDKYEIAEDSEGDLCSGHKIYGSADASLLNVGDTLPEDLKPLIFDIVGNDVTENYDIIDFIIPERESITVIPRPISVRPVPKEKVYDGEELVADEIVFVDDKKPVDGQTFEFVINEGGYTDKITDVGSIDTRITSLKIYAVIDGVTVDVTENYDFNLYEYIEKLTVTPRPLTVVAKSATYVYNGEEQSYDGEPEAERVEGLVEGDGMSVSYYGSRKDVGVGENRIIVTVNDNYAITCIQGTIEITPYELKLTTGSSEKYYDGSALTDANYSGYELANKNHFIESGDLPSITDAGEIANAYNVSIRDKNNGNEDVTDNYAIEYEYGTLTVKVLPVKVTLQNGEDREKVYFDGTAHTPTIDDSSYFSVEPFLPDGKEVTFNLSSGDFEVVSETREMRNAGEYYYKVKFKDGEVEQRRLYSNYELFVPESGILEVTPLPVYVTLKEYEDDDAFTYSCKAVKLDAEDAIDDLQCGTELPDGVIFENLLTRNDFAIDADEIIDAGEDYTYTVKITDAITAANFGLEISGSVDGAKARVVVNPMPVTVTLADAERTYNGKAHTVSVAEAVVGIKKTDPASADDETGLTASDLVIVYSEESCVDADDYTFIVEGARLRTRNNYEITTVNAADADLDCAKLTINKFYLEVTTDTREFDYDGKKHTSGVFTNGRLANKDHEIVLAEDAELPAVVDVCDEFKTEIKKENVFAVEIFDGEKKVTDNYDISYNYGTLSVNRITVTVKTGDWEEVYSGYEISNDSVEIQTELDGVMSDYKAVIATDTLPCTLTEVGSVANVFECQILTKGNKDVTGNFDVKYVYGTLKVTPLTIRFTLSDFSGSADMVYDGAPKTFEVRDAIEEIYDESGNGYAIGARTEELLDGINFTFEDFEIVYYSLVQDAGSYMYSVKFADEAFAKNFEVKGLTSATVTVKKRPVEIKLNDFTDENALTFNNRVQTISVTDAVGEINGAMGADGKVLIDTDDLTVIYSEQLFNAGNYKYKVKIDSDAVAKNFICTVNAAAVVINKYDLNVALKDYTETYSGKEFVFPDDAVTIVGAASADDEAVLSAVSSEDFTISVTEGRRILNADTYTYGVALKSASLKRNLNLKTVVDTGYGATVKINKADVAVTLKPIELTFNGEEQRLEGALALEFTDETSLLTAEDFTIEVTQNGAKATLKKSGNYEYSVTLSDDNFKLIGATGNTLTGGSVKIKNYKVTVTLNTLNKEYDGEEFDLQPQNSIYSVSGSMFDANDFVVSYADYATEHSAADTYNLKASLAAAHDDIKGDVDIEVKNTVATIAKRVITITTRTESFVYDGREHSSTEAKLSGAVFGHFAKVEDDGIVTVSTVGQGAVTNNSVYGIYRKTGDGVDEEVTENYIIDEFNSSYGTLTVTPRPVTFTTGSARREYTGAKLICDTVTHDKGLLTALDHEYVLPAADELPFQIEVGEKENGYEGITIIDGRTGEIVTDNYAIGYEYGTLEIIPVAIKVTFKATIEQTYKGTDVSLAGGDVIETVERVEAGGAALTIDAGDFAVIFEGGVINAGEYSFTVEVMSERHPERYDVTTHGKNVLTVNKRALTVTLKNYADNTYTGAVQEVPADSVASVGSSPDGVTADKFGFTYTVDMLNVGTYAYGAVLKDATLNSNYEVSVTGGEYVIVPASIRVTLQNYEKTYNGKTYTVEASQAITGITDSTGAASTLLSAHDFTVVYNDELRLANNYHERLVDGETYDGETITVNGYECKVLTPDVYTYGVRITDSEKSKNFELTVEGGDFRINKRKLTLTVSAVYMSKEEYQAIANSADVDVTENVSVSLNTPLAEGDQLQIISAVANRSTLDVPTFYLNALDDYELTNEGCYEFTNVNGDSDKSATVKVIVNG